MKIDLNNPTEEVQIQIIPLIDVVFCILTFFILASLQFTRQQSINIDLPQAETATSSVPAQGGRNILPVTIDAVGQTFVEKQPVQRSSLEGILRNYIQQNPQGTLVLNASRSATYNDVVEILDLLRLVGGDRVSLAIIPTPPNQQIDPSQPIPGFPTNTNPGVNPDGTLPLPNVSPLNPNLPQNNPNLNLPPNSAPLPLPNIPNQPQTEQVPPASAPTVAPPQTNPSP